MDTDALCRAEIEFWRARGIGGRKSALPALELVQTLLKAALAQGATRLLWQCQRAALLVRWKRGGRWEEARVLPLELGAVLAAAAKSWFEMPAQETRFPMSHNRRLGRWDCAIHTVPAIWGETVDFEFSRVKRKPFSLARLGLLPSQRRQLERWRTRKSGLVLFSSFQDSIGFWGVDTRLTETLLNVFSSPDFATACLVRDPIALPDWAIQIAINRDFRHADALHSLLRSDVDVVATPHFYDLSSAELLVQLALTGKLVLAQQHSSWHHAASMPTYLCNMGVEQFLVAESLTGALSCKWVRRLCPHCAQPWTPPRWQIEFLQRELRPYNVGVSPRGNWKRPVGCARCDQTGFRGEIGAFELLDVADDLAMQRTIVEGADLLKLARQSGYQPALVAALEHARRGCTSIQEALRVCLKPAHSSW